MYLHIGNNRNIRVSQIIGIFDADSATVSEVTKKYLSSFDRNHSVAFASEEIPKSFILYRDRDGKIRIFFSQLSPASLLNRISNPLSI